MVKSAGEFNFLIFRTFFFFFFFFCSSDFHTLVALIIADCVRYCRRSVGSIVANTSIYYYDIHDFSCSCRTVHGRDVGRPNGAVK